MKKPATNTTAPWFIPSGELLAVRPDVLDTLRALDGKTPREIKAESFLEEPASEPCPEEEIGTVCVIPMIGPITSYAGVCDWMLGGCSVERMEAQLEQAKDDPSVDGILLKVDSVGGMACLIHDFAQKIRDVSAIKPVVAMITGNGASAAYWLASAATKIVMSKTAFAGAIGACVTYRDTSKADQMAGIKYKTYISKQSPKKNLDPNTPEGADGLQQMADSLGEIFVESVATLRGVEIDKVLKDFGQGDVLIAANAIANGMADQLGTMADAISLVLELAGKGSGPESGTSSATRKATADTRLGGNMADKKTAEQLHSEFPEAASQIASQAATAERERVAGILALNTNANRAVAGELIDNAIKDGKTDAGGLAVQILGLQREATAEVEKAREADAKGMPKIPSSEAPEAPTAAASKIDTSAVYAQMNGGTK